MFDLHLLCVPIISFHVVSFFFCPTTPLPLLCAIDCTCLNMNCNHIFQRWISGFPQRWRTPRNAIRNANCRIKWVIKSLNANCCSRFLAGACLVQTLSTTITLSLHGCWGDDDPCAPPGRVDWNECGAPFWYCWTFADPTATDQGNGDPCFRVCLRCDCKCDRGCGPVALFSR